MISTTFRVYATRATIRSQVERPTNVVTRVKVEANSYERRIWRIKI